MVSFHIIGTPAKVKCAVDCVQIHANKWRSFKWKIAKLILHIDVLYLLLPPFVFVRDSEIGRRGGNLYTKQKNRASR